jgi:hypothetical protein
VVVGGKGTGKSVYITVLLHELHQGLGERLGAEVLTADLDRTRRRIDAELQDRLYEQRRLLPPTQWASAGWNHIEPLAFELTIRSDRARRPRRRPTLLLLYDTSGAELEAGVGKGMLTGCLVRAAGIILLLDPSPPGPSVDASPVEVVGRMTEMLRATVASSAADRLDTPVAVTLSKSDTLWERLSSESALRRSPDRRPSPVDGDEVDREVRELLPDLGADKVDQLLQEQYSRFRYFAVSALGGPPRPGNRVPSGGIGPRNVEQPFVWLLRQFVGVPRLGDGS